MNKLLTITAALFTAIDAAASTTTTTVTVSNPSSTERKAVPVVMQLDDDVRTALVTLDGKEIACQLDDLDDDGQYDELVFLTDLQGKEKLTFKVELSDEGSPRDYSPKTFAYVGIRDRQSDPKKQQHQQIKSVTFPATTNPYNYIFPHGAVMENDMVGFRAYCDWRQSIDYYGHRQLKTDVKDTWFYASKEQKASGFGEDVLYTGSTYGCGALHGWDGQTSVMFKNVRNSTQTVVAEGPVRTILDISNKGWKPVEGQPSTDIRTRYILYMGHRDVEVQVQFSRDVSDLPLSTGIVDIPGSEKYSDNKGLRGCWGTAIAGNNPQVYDVRTVGLGVYVPEKYYKADAYFTDGKESLPNQAYAVVLGTSDDTVHYWFTATCDIESFGFPSSAEWFKHLQQWKQERATPAVITIKSDSKNSKSSTRKSKTGSRMHKIL